MEQVVGYEAPKKPSADAGGEGGYESMGDMGLDTTVKSADATTGGTTDENQAAADQIKQLTVKRQSALDAGNTVAAQNAAQQLAVLRRTRG